MERKVKLHNDSDMIFQRCKRYTFRFPAMHCSTRRSEETHAKYIDYKVFVAEHLHGSLSAMDIMMTYGHSHLKIVEIAVRVAGRLRDSLFVCPTCN